MPTLTNDLCQRRNYGNWLLRQSLSLNFQELALSFTNGQSVMVNAMVLSFALPKLMLADDQSVDKIIFDIDVNSRTVTKLKKMLYTGEVCLDSEEEERELQTLCQELQLNIEKDDLFSNEADPEFYEPSSSPTPSTSMERKVKSKRVFTANLTTEDLTCDICDRVFTAMYKLKIHKLVHSSTPPFLCNHCGRGFNNKYKMRAHEKRHCQNNSAKPWLLTPDADCLDKSLACEKCGALFDTKKSRMDHIQAAHPLYHASTHSCQICQKVFKNIKGLRNHEKNVKCSQMAKRRKQTIDQAETNLAFKCLRCSVICSSKKSLKNHTRSAHWQELGEDEALPFRCLPCGKAFLKQSYFEEHQNRYHSLVKAFVCMFCPKRCATKQDLDRHLISHRGEALYPCAYCAKRFVHRASLTRHQRGHLGERPYHCQVCGKGFGLLSVLQKHQKFHEKKGDRTEIITAPKGQRGHCQYSRIVFTSDFHAADMKNQVEYQTEQQMYQVMEMDNQEETESIANDILGLLRT